MVEHIKYTHYNRTWKEMPEKDHDHRPHGFGAPSGQNRAGYDADDGPSGTTKEIAYLDPRF